MFIYWRFWDGIGAHGWVRGSVIWTLAVIPLCMHYMLFKFVLLFFIAKLQCFIIV